MGCPSGVNLIVLDLSLESLDPSPRLSRVLVSRVLEAAGLRSVRDAVRCSRRFLKEDRKMAPVCLREMNRMLAGIGCCLSEREVQLDLPTFFDDFGHQDAFVFNAGIDTFG